MANPLPSLYNDAPKKIPSQRSPVAADQTYIDKVFGTYVGQQGMLLEGTCIEYNQTLKTIKVDLDISKKPGASLTPQEITAEWGRPNLARTEVLNKRVRLFKQISFVNSTTEPGRQDRKEAIALHAVMPPGTI